MEDYQWKLLKNSILLVVIVFITFVLVLPLFGFDVMRYLRNEVELSDFFQPIDLSNVDDYQYFGDIGYGGMILERDAGEDDIREAIEERDIVMGCSGCSGCSEMFPEYKNPGSPYYIEGWEALQCSSCSSCDGITEYNRFENCLECGAGECALCEDYYYLCNRLEQCIFECYSNPEYCERDGCTITQIERGEDAYFDVNWFKDVLSSCKAKSLMMNIGNDVERELCYLDTSDISYYDFNREHDFYLTDKISYAVTEPEDRIWDPDISLKPFYTDGGESFPKYRVYVVIQSHSRVEETYGIKIGRYRTGELLDPVKHNYQSETIIGSVTTDSNGFGYAELSYGDIDRAHYQYGSFNDYFPEWKTDPDEFFIEHGGINGIRIEDNGAGETITAYVAFYANEPASNEVWPYELRYSQCNLITNPELYLGERPWWVTTADSMSYSPWTLKSGNVETPIKVFYDPTLPGGGSNGFSLDKIRGNIKISLGRLDTNLLRKCKFDLYVCTQDAFAEMEDDAITTIKDFFTYFNPSNLYKRVKDGEKEFIIYNYFEFGLDKDYTVNEIRSAIETGFRLWENDQFIYTSTVTSPASSLDWLSSANNDGLLEGNWGPLIAPSYNNDCWDSSLYDRFKNSDGRYIATNCPGGICRESLKVRVAFEYRAPSATNPWKTPLSTMITFCGK